MKTKVLRYERWQRELTLMVVDYLRYTFTPTFALIMLIGSLVGFGIMAVLLYQFQPLVAAVIFGSYTTIFSVAMVLSFLQWKRYKDFYKEIFHK